MYYKTLYFDIEENDINSDTIYNRLVEASFLDQVETINQGYYGRDKKDNFFLMKVAKVIQRIEIQIESDDYDLIIKLSNIISENNYIGTPIVNEYSFVKKISGDISVIKGIMIFYVILTILGFIYLISI